MLTFDPLKRLTAQQCLQHPYFEGYTYNPAQIVQPTSAHGSNILPGVPGAGGFNNSKGNFFKNPNNEINKPSSNSKRIESRKGIVSRKDSVNKNNFYMQKGKVPDYLPNKPTLVGSRGSNEGIPQGYFNKGPLGSGASGGAGSNVGSSIVSNIPTLPVLSNPYQSSVAKNSALGGNRVKSLPPGQPPSYMPTYKYSGIGGGSGAGVGSSGGYDSGAGAMYGGGE